MWMTLWKGSSGYDQRPTQGNKVWNGKDPDPSSSPAPYKIYNIGNSKPVKLMDFINAIEKYLGKKAIIEYQPMQAGDVKKTWANTNDLIEDFSYAPVWSVDKGIGRFIDWLKKYY